MEKNGADWGKNSSRRWEGGKGGGLLSGREKKQGIGRGQITY